MSDKSSGFTATASSIYDGSYPASKVLDGSTGGLPWASQSVDAGGAINEWLKFTHSTSATITEFKAYIEKAPDARAKDYVLEGSNDDSNWTELKTGTYTNDLGWQTTGTFANSTAYKYYRWTITSMYGTANPNQVAIFECQLWGF